MKQNRKFTKALFLDRLSTEETVIAIDRSPENSEYNRRHQVLKYRLIASDLDGTLLDDQKRISDRAKAAISEYQRRGGIFTIATGRKEESARKFVEMIHVSAPIVAFNGAKIVDFSKNEVLQESFLDTSIAISAYTALRAIGKDIVVYTDGKPLISGNTPNIGRYMDRIEISMKVIEDVSELCGRLITKILVIDPRQEQGGMVKLIEPIFGEYLNAISSDDEFLELLPPGVSKGRALTALADTLGISMAETIAIGDHLNDISMIQAAGLGVAVENAREETRQAADYITMDNNHDGVALIIEKALAGSAVL